MLLSLPDLKSDETNLVLTPTRPFKCRRLLCFALTHLRILEAHAGMLRGKVPQQLRVWMELFRPIMKLPCMAQQHHGLPMQTMHHASQSHILLAYAVERPNVPAVSRQAHDGQPAALVRHTRLANIQVPHPVRVLNNVINVSTQADFFARVLRRLFRRITRPVRRKTRGHHQQRTQQKKQNNAHGKHLATRSDASLLPVPTTRQSTSVMTGSGEPRSLSCDLCGYRTWTSSFFPFDHAFVSAPAGASNRSPTRAP